MWWEGVMRWCGNSGFFAVGCILCGHFVGGM